MFIIRDIMQIQKKLLKWFALPFIVTGFTYVIACTYQPIATHWIDVSKNVCIKPHSEYTYKTCSSFVVTIDKEKFIIPEGFETDLASIPRWYWMILAPQYSSFVQPAVIHDYFYRCANTKTRHFADEVFYYALLNNNVAPYTASKFYFAVRVFGAHSYSKSLTCQGRVTNANVKAKSN